MVLFGGLLGVMKNEHRYARYGHGYVHTGALLKGQPRTDETLCLLQEKEGGSCTISLLYTRATSEILFKKRL